MWLKIKQQASGWPSWCQWEEQKQQFINNYKNVEGIEHEYDKINRNEALRFIAKMFFNSFWGKLAQTPNLPATEVENTYDQYMKLISDKSKKIK